MGPGWPALSPVPPLAVSERAGEARDHAVVKEERVQRSFCISAVSRNSSVDRGLFVQKPRAFLQERQRACGLPTWAVFARGPSPSWATLGRSGLFLFLAELVKLFYFNSELDLCGRTA